MGAVHLQELNIPITAPDELSVLSQFWEMIENEDIIFQVSCDKFRLTLRFSRMFTVVLNTHPSFLVNTHPFCLASRVPWESGTGDALGVGKPGPLAAERGQEWYQQGNFTSREQYMGHVALVATTGTI